MATDKDWLERIKKDALTWHNCALVRGERPTLFDVIGHLDERHFLHPPAQPEAVREQGVSEAEKAEALAAWTRINNWLVNASISPSYSNFTGGLYYHDQQRLFKLLREIAPAPLDVAQGE